MRRRAQGNSLGPENDIVDGVGEIVEREEATQSVAFVAGDGAGAIIQS